MATTSIDLFLRQETSSFRGHTGYGRCIFLEDQDFGDNAIQSQPGPVLFDSDFSLLPFLCHFLSVRVLHGVQNSDQGSV